MIVALLFVFAQSFQGPQKPDSTANRQQAPAAYQRGADSLPVSVKLLNTGENEAAAKQNAQRIREERANARSNLVLTGALVVATLLSLGVLGYQSYWLKRSVTHAEKTARIELRAYIHASNVSIRPDIARVDLTNVGKTPAQEVRSWGHVYHGPKGSWNPKFERQSRENRLTISPGGTISQTVTVPQLTAEDQAKIASGDVAIIAFHGGVNYTDVFGDSWETEYCYDVTVAELPVIRVGMTEGYNKAT